MVVKYHELPILGTVVDCLVGMKSYDIWIEGYAITGGSGEATHHGSFRAENFDQAIDMWLDTMSDEEIYQYYQWYPGREHPHTWWGCRIFDNETDARKAFG